MNLSYKKEVIKIDNKKQQHGNALIISIALVLVIAVGAFYWIKTRKDTYLGTPIDPPMLIQDTKEVSPSVQKDTILSEWMNMEQYDYMAELSDVFGGEASGTAYYTYEDSTYTLYATFEDLPKLEEGFFYEGWVVSNNPVEAVSTGALELKNGVWVNEFTSSRNLMNHKQYVLTLEPDDGDPAPAEHVVEGMFVKYTN